MEEDLQYSSDSHSQYSSSMAEDSQYSTDSIHSIGSIHNKRKHEDYHRPSYLSRRPSGFSDPIINSTTQRARLVNREYEEQQAKRRAHEIAARLFNFDSVRSPSSQPLVGKATLFEKSADTSKLYGCEDFKEVYNFLVPPRHEDFYRKIVQEHGHIPSIRVVSEMNTLITATRVVLDVGIEMTSLGDSIPSTEKLQSWNTALDSARALQFNISWLEDLLRNLEAKCVARRKSLSIEIDQLKKDMVHLEDIRLRVVKEAEEVASRWKVANASFSATKKLVEEKKNDLAALPLFCFFPSV